MPLKGLGKPQYFPVNTFSPITLLFHHPLPLHLLISTHSAPAFAYFSTLDIIIFLFIKTLNPIFFFDFIQSQLSSYSPSYSHFNLFRPIIFSHHHTHLHYLSASTCTAPLSFHIITLIFIIFLHQYAQAHYLFISTYLILIPILSVRQHTYSHFIHMSTLTFIL